MRRITVIAMLVGLGLAAGATAAAPPKQEVPAATRLASKLTGIKVKHRVKVRMVTAKQMGQQARRLLDRDYPPAAQAYDQTVYRALGLLGGSQELRPELLAAATTNVPVLYDPVSHVLYVRKGPNRQVALLHGLVRALEDQAFNLRRTSGLRRSDRDAALAATAAIEGEASFTTSLLGSSKASASKSPAILSGTPIHKFLTLEQEFPATVGRRFISMLHNLGGSKAVFTALKTFPATTEQVFRIEAFLTHEPALPVTLPTSAGDFALQHSDTFGELDVQALLAAFDVPQLDSAATGWGGGRSAVFVNAAGATAVTVALTWDTETDAQQWATAAAAYVSDAFGASASATPATTPCATGATCWQFADRSVAFAQNGARTVLTVAPDVTSAGSIAAAVVGAS